MASIEFSPPAGGPLFLDDTSESDIFFFKDNESSPTQANLSAIALPSKVNYDGLVDRNNASELIGVVDNSNILPLSLNDSRADANESAPISNNS